MTDQGKFLVAHAKGSSWQEAADAIIRELQSIGTEHQISVCDRCLRRFVQGDFDLLAAKNRRATLGRYGGIWHLRPG